MLSLRVNARIAPLSPGEDVGTRLVFIGLGSNLGTREENLLTALRLLGQHGHAPWRLSSVYITEPVEVLDQGEFLNQVAALRSDAAPEVILKACLDVERAMGRVRDRSRGSRIIDLDLLLSGDDVRTAEDIVVPHPRMHLRRFVLVPLLEIAPDARHPILARTVAELLQACPDRSRVERFGSARVR
jgi:2-amino-4-hydroxy-6-hydroxymethyldihydropteridine diphosphokinase